jgi:putative MFS transporter
MILIALGEFVDGYDLLVVSGALLLLIPKFHLTPGVTGLLGGAAFVGAAVGLFFFGDLTDRIGRRKVFNFNLIGFVVFALLSAIITNVPELFIARFIMGIAIGADIATSMAFLAEISPRSHRGALTGALPQIAWTVGALCSLAVAVWLFHVAGTAAWRWMFGISALPALLVLLGRQLLPESPRWLLKQGKEDEAVASLEKYGVPQARSIVESLATHRNESNGSYLDLFRKPYTRQAILAFVIVGFTPLTGAIASVVGPYVFRYVGLLGKTASLESSMLLWVGGIIGAIVAYATIDYIGRFWSTVISCAGAFVCSVTLALIGPHHPTLFLAVYMLLAALTWFGASSFWVLPSELLPTHLRGRAQGFGNGIARLMVAVTTFIIPVGIAHLGFDATLVLLGCVGLLIALYALTGLKFEPKRRSLETVSLDS